MLSTAEKVCKALLVAISGQPLELVDGSAVALRAKNAGVYINDHLLPLVKRWTVHDAESPVGKFVVKVAEALDKIAAEIPAGDPLTMAEMLLRLRRKAAWTRHLDTIVKAWEALWDAICHKETSDELRYEDKTGCNSIFPKMYSQSGPLRGVCLVEVSFKDLLASFCARIDHEDIIYRRKRDCVHEPTIPNSFWALSSASPAPAGTGTATPAMLDKSKHIAAAAAVTVLGRSTRSLRCCSAMLRLLNKDIPPRSQVLLAAREAIDPWWTVLLESEAVGTPISSPVSASTPSSTMPPSPAESEFSRAHSRGHLRTPTVGWHRLFSTILRAIGHGITAESLRAGTSRHLRHMHEEIVAHMTFDFHRLGTGTGWPPEACTTLLGQFVQYAIRLVFRQFQRIKFSKRRGEPALRPMLHVLTGEAVCVKHDISAGTARTRAIPQSSPASLVNATNAWCDDGGDGDEGEVRGSTLYPDLLDETDLDVPCDDDEDMSEGLQHLVHKDAADALELLQVRELDEADIGLDTDGADDKDYPSLPAAENADADESWTILDGLRKALGMFMLPSI